MFRFFSNKNKHYKDNNAPPDLEDLLKRFFGKKKKSNLNDEQSIYSKNSNKDRTPLPIKKIGSGIVALVILAWAGLGLYIVQPAEEAAVLRLGKFQSIEGPGLHWHPAGIYEIIKENVEEVRTISLTRDMLTSEENIVRVSFTVQYKIGNIQSFLFNVSDPVNALNQALEASVRNVVGANNLEDILTTNRAIITNEVRSNVEKLMKRYKSGVQIIEVIMQPAQAPNEVREAFDDVIQAREDRVRIINEAKSYSNKIIPQAKGRAQRVLDEANAYATEIVYKSEGNIAEFKQLLPLYIQNKDVLLNQIYLDTMEKIAANNKFFVVDGPGAKNLFYNTGGHLDDNSKLGASIEGAKS